MGVFVQQAIDNAPKGGEAQVDELDGFITRSGDGHVNVFLIFNEEWFEIGLVDMGRDLELWAKNNVCIAVFNSRRMLSRITVVICPGPTAELPSNSQI